MNHSMPSLFISHGAPSIAIEQDDFTRAVASFGESLRDARAIVVVSAHWQARSVRVNAVAHPETIYDFGGFSEELYKIRYQAPGHPELAHEIAALVGGAPLEESRGWDHGLWVPMRILLPNANIPIVEIAQPFPTSPSELLRIGAALAPLRDRGIVIAGSGGIVHNLRAIHLADKDAPVDDWAKQFDDWFATHLAARDFETLTRYRELAPHANLAVPTPEHFEPVFVALGASNENDSLTTIFEGFHYGNLSMRTFVFAA
jgi:4,5-DOPA dioxygenase extradiol